MRVAVRFLRRRFPAEPSVAVILGSGLGAMNFGPVRASVSYTDIPFFPVPSAPGHPGRLDLCGELAVLRGRVHHYEGWDFEEIARPVRTMARWGVRTLVVTQAAGAVNPALRPGDLLILADHLNLMGGNPLRGSPRFTDLTEAYDRGLRRRFRAAARSAGWHLREGVYAAVPGPCYETPAEVRMIRRLGADVVGMSTVPEVIAAVEAGMRVAGVTVVTNRAAGLGRERISPEEVLRVSRQAVPRLERLLKAVLAEFLQDLRGSGRLNYCKGEGGRIS